MPATYEKIATTTLGSAASAITFSSIPATYTDLKIIFTGSYTVASRPSVRFNSDTGTNYSFTRLWGDGTSASSGRRSNDPYLFLAISDFSNRCFYEIDIFSYAGSTYKTALMTLSQDNNGSGNVIKQVGLWRSTSAITTIELSDYDAGTTVAGSTATLYGILKA